MIKYLGSKRLLLDDLSKIVFSFPELSSICDMFSGTSRCGHRFKQNGLSVVSNDTSSYAAALATCYVKANSTKLIPDVSTLVDEFNKLPGKPGYFTDTYCVQSRFFQPFNGERIDAIREAIDQKSLDPVLRDVLLVSLMEAADRVDSTCGVQMAYIKQWSKRSFAPLQLRVPNMLPHVPNRYYETFQQDAATLASQVSTDICYLDPPYNQHSYLSNYHIWESLVLNDRPDVYGVARKRRDCQTRKSPYNAKKKHFEAFSQLVNSLNTKLLIVSFNNEGYLTKDQMVQILSDKYLVFTIEKPYKRYVGAQIGIHNPAGEKVGQVSHTRNTEFIYLGVSQELLRTVPDAPARCESLVCSL